jgi:class 3 adenylate cyclase
VGILLSWAATTQLGQIERVAGLVERLLPGFVRDTGLEELGRIREQEASLLYTDIRNYTSISEQLRADEVLRLVGLYRAMVEEVVTEHGGAIAHTPGDAVLAVFWRKWNGAGHATCALRAGIGLLSGLPALVGTWQQAGVGLDIGVGVNTGPVAMGFLGKAKLEATVVGDAVNLAQRLESLTKDLGHRLLFSGSIHARLEDDVPAVHLGEVSVRGREGRTKVYGIGSNAPKDA